MQNIDCIAAAKLAKKIGLPKAEPCNDDDEWLFNEWVPFYRLQTRFKSSLRHRRNQGPFTKPCPLRACRQYRSEREFDIDVDLESWCENILDGTDYREQEDL